MKRACIGAPENDCEAGLQAPSCRQIGCTPLSTSAPDPLPPPRLPTTLTLHHLPAHLPA